MAVENRNWIIVADESKARFFYTAGKSGPITEDAMIENETGRAHMDELISDHGGRSFDSHGEGRHTLSQNHDKKETSAIRFADAVVDRLVREVRDGHVVRYSLVAAPRFLGYLRKALGKHSIEAPYRAVSKDLVDHDAETIRQAVQRAE